MPQPIRPDTVRIVFEGVPYFRYPNSKRRENRSYFNGGSGRILHRAIWEHHYGPIPAGNHIHHRDGNPLNNALENLECLPAAKHLSDHAAKVWAEPGRRAAAAKRLRARNATGEMHVWYKTPEGLEKRRQAGAKSWDGRKPVKHICAHCGVEYESLRPDRAKFCTLACKAAARRKSGVDREERICELCGQPFMVDRHRKTRGCSRSCGRRIADAARRANL